MRRQSMSAAKRCETAKHKECRCRCGGLLHGSRRGEESTFFEGLPEDDPHFALEPKRRKEKAGVAAQ